MHFWVVGEGEAWQATPRDLQAVSEAMKGLEVWSDYFFVLNSAESYAKEYRRDERSLIISKRQAKDAGKV